ncbi:DUF2158 domain-containing protein [Chitinophaga sp. 212800010-3]|uniref:DUF2158 domain-containing protein n=1 Tax=unclassified Chitinophaga TaxID=2619133 RepID=UPI002DF0ABBD|nr:hypothetical protein [Chitinophaga sp. 212800010-3]
MAETFNPGDLVILKSGGPVMTVLSVNNTDNGTIVSYWFNSSTSKFEQVELPQVLLTKNIPKRKDGSFLAYSGGY